jgi:molybdenum cofactor cytidylyltransferase
MSREAARVAGVVLAAGSSQRMGRSKQLLPLAGRPLLQHVIDAASAAGLAEIVVVLGHAAAEIRAAITVPARCRVVVNEEHAAGQSSSLARGLATLGPDVAAAAVLLGDQPGLTSGLVDRVIAAFLAGDAAAVRPTWLDGDGARQPGHPVVLARRLWPAVAALTGDEGARGLLARHPEWLCELAIPGESPPDIDDMDDYRRALAATGVAATGG